MKKILPLFLLIFPLVTYADVLPICTSDSFKQTIKKKYTNIDCENRHGLFITENQQGLLGAIDNKGQVVIQNIYQQIDAQYDYPYFYVKQNNLWGVIDKTGKILIPTIYTTIQPYNEDVGVFVVEKNNQWGIVNNKNQFIGDNNYSLIGEFSDGLAPACKNKQCGYLDKNSQTAIAFIYQDAFHFNQNYDLALVKSDKGYHYINKQNQTVVYFDYKDNLIPDPIIINGFITVNTYDKVSDVESYGIYNTTGKMILPAVYESIYYDKEKLPIIVKKDGKYGLYSRQGKKLLDEKYSYIDVYHCGIASVSQIINKKEQKGYIDTNGQFVIKLGQHPQLKTINDALAYLKINPYDKSCNDISSEQMLSVISTP